MKAAWTIAALLCCIPTAASTSFTATALDVDWASLQGDAPAMLYVSSAAGDSFDLHADMVTLESEWIRQVMVGEVGHETDPPSTDTATYGNSSWVAKSRAAQASLFVVPSDAKLSSGRGTGSVSLPAIECLQQPTYFSGMHPTACPDTRSSLRLQGQATQWLVEGNFTIVLWAWEGSSTDAEGGTAFWTGSRPTQLNLLGLGQVELRQAVLRVTNGSLRLDLAEDAVLDAYATALALATDKALPLGSAVEGDAILGTASEGSLQLRRGDPSTILSTQARPLKPAFSWNGWQIGVLGAGLLFVPIGLVQTRRQGAFVHLRLANRNMEIDNPLAAARHAAKAARLRDLKVEANVLGAIAAMKAQDFDGAQRFLHDLHKQRVHDEAACRYLLAHMRIQQGRHEEGQALLEECLAMDASYDSEVAANPVLAPFLDPSKWPRTVR